MTIKTQTDPVLTGALNTLHKVEATLERSISEPYGPPARDGSKTVAGNACVFLCDGDKDKARALWKVIADDLGYMPQAAAVALIRAANTANLVPDVTAPDPT